jgi:tRNA(fMet)-specific endonuclease VapC
MYILDTDHLSVLDRGGVKAQSLLQRLAGVDLMTVMLTWISFKQDLGDSREYQNELY